MVFLPRSRFLHLGVSFFPLSRVARSCREPLPRQSSSRVQTRRSRSRLTSRAGTRSYVYISGSAARCSRARKKKPRSKDAPTSMAEEDVSRRRRVVLRRAGGAFSSASYQFNLLYKGVPLLTALPVTSRARAHGEQVVEQVARCTIRRGIRRKRAYVRLSVGRGGEQVCVERRRGQRNSYTAEMTIRRCGGGLDPTCARCIDSPCRRKGSADTWECGGKQTGSRNATCKIARSVLAGAS